MKWDIKNIEKWKAEEHPLGATIPEAGNARSYETGSWRTLRPLRDDDKCTHCLICPIHCPDQAIPVKNDRMMQFDLRYCKGCGICAEVCPFDAISMILEVSRDKERGR